MNQYQTLIDKALEGLDASLNFYSCLSMDEEKAFVEFKSLQKELCLAKARIGGDRKIEADLAPSLMNAAALLMVAGGIIRNHGLPLWAREIEETAAGIKSSVNELGGQHEVL